jgi:serine/threonine-protein kinase
METIIAPPVPPAAVPLPEGLGLKIGDILDDRFRLTAVISAGGMATIFKALDLHHENQIVAVKVPHPKFASGLGSYSLHQREEELGRQLDHPSILKFIPVAGKKRRPYIVTEYVPGCALADLLAVQCPLPEPEALRIAALVAEALQYLHEHGVVHYDLNPRNVMLCPGGGIRLIDFGLAQAVETHRFTLGAASPAIGSSDYIAPEQIKRQRGRTSADIYSLGAMLYEMLTGQPPFTGDDPFVIMNARMTGDPVAPRQLNPRLTPPTEEIVLRALRRRPSDRYPTAAALKADLDAPARVKVTGLCHRLKPSTPWKRGLRMTRYIALTCVVPIASLVAAFFVLTHYFAHHHR